MTVIDLNRVKKSGSWMLITVKISRANAVSEVALFPCVNTWSAHVATGWSRHAAKEFLSILRLSDPCNLTEEWSSKVPPPHRKSFPAIPSLSLLDP